MLLSKKAARVLAIASTFAFTLTGMSAAQPAKVQAAVDQAPTVKVLGATLRLDGESGAQSLRFGIEVSNASNAEACGIDITYKGKTVTVGTDVENDTTNGKKKHTAVYSKDEANDKIVYSAVITGIPKANYADLFEVKGYAKEKVADIVKQETEIAGRSVNKVVEVLQKTDPNIKIDDETGNLVKVETAEDGTVTTRPVEKEDFIGVDSIPSPFEMNESLKCINLKGKSYAVNSDGSVTLVNHSCNEEIEINVPSTPFNRIVIDYEYTDSEGATDDDEYGIKWYNPDEKYVSWDSAYRFSKDLKLKVIGFDSSEVPVNKMVITDRKSKNRTLTLKSIKFINTEKPEAEVYSKDNLVVNGDFSNGSEGWTSNYGKTFSVSNDGYAVVDGRWNEWSKPIMVTTGEFKKGDKLLLSYDVTVLGEEQQFILNYGFGSKDNVDKNACESFGKSSYKTWNRFVREFDVTEDTDTFAFSIRSVTRDTFYLDNVYLCKVEGSESILTSDNVAIKDQYCTKLNEHGGKMDLQLSYNYGGFGVAFYIDKATKESVDLSKYEKVVVSITADKQYPLMFATKNDIKKPNDYWENGATQNNVQYFDTQIGTKEYEFDVNGNGQAVFIKYNPGELDYDAMLTINSIEFVEKAAP